MDVAPLEVTGAHKAPHVVKTLLRVIAILHVLQGLHLRRGWFPRAIPHIETQILHLLFHELAFFEFDSEIIFLTNNEKFTKEKDMVLLGHWYPNSHHRCGPPFLHLEKSPPVLEACASVCT